MAVVLDDDDAHVLRDNATSGLRQSSAGPVPHFARQSFPTIALRAPALDICAAINPSQTASIAHFNHTHDRIPRTILSR